MCLEDLPCSGGACHQYIRRTHSLASLLFLLNTLAANLADYPLRVWNRDGQTQPIHAGQNPETDPTGGRVGPGRRRSRTDFAEQGTYEGRLRTADC